MKLLGFVDPLGWYVMRMHEAYCNDFPAEKRRLRGGVKACDRLIERLAEGHARSFGMRIVLSQ
ncbi:MAG: hypothetical protein P4M11_04445 [Candidatus Pacebacteria bacterium]|nr:hypothetical protein [Candidatus Paceibacterota bacterium]